MKLRLSDEEKGFILTHHLNKSLGRMAELLGRSRHTINSFLSRFKTEKRIINKKPGGRKAALKDEDLRLIYSYVQRHPKTTLHFLKEQLNLSCSLQTISKALHKQGYRKFKIRNKPKLMPRHVEARLKFVEKFKNMNWDKVLFTDESSVEYFKFYSEKVWRKPGEACKPGMYRPKKTQYSKKYLKIWSCFSSKGVGKVVFVQPGWNRWQYLKILRENLLAEGKRLIGRDFVMQSDGDTVHKADVVLKWLKFMKINLIDPKAEWPASSPGKSTINLRLESSKLYLNFKIENLWFYMKKKLSSLPFRDLDNFKRNIELIWSNIRPQTCKSLVDSMPRRLEKVLANQGFATKY